MKIAKRVVSIVLWVFAAAFLAYTVWAIVESKNTVDQAVAAGQVLGGFNYTIISYYMASCAPYFAYALLFGVGGMILWIWSVPSAFEVEEDVFITEEEEDEAFPVAENMPAAEESAWAGAKAEAKEAEAAVEHKAEEAVAAVEEKAAE